MQYLKQFRKMTGLFKTLFLIFFFFATSNPNHIKQTLGLISNIYFAFYRKESFDVPVILHFIFFFWFLDHALQNIWIYQNIYPREYGKTFKVVLFKKNLIFCNRKLKCLQYLKQIRKAKGHFKTQFLIIFFFLQHQIQII